MRSWESSSGKEEGNISELDLQKIDIHNEYFEFHTNFLKDIDLEEPDEDDSHASHIILKLREQKDSLMNKFEAH